MNMKKYYNEIFPYSNMYKFLRLTPFRELTFRYDNIFFKRYISINSLDEFQNIIKIKTPSQIDIGAFYNKIPEKNIPLKVISRELVFDVDITDYKRNCECNESENKKKLCDECFIIIKAAIGVLDYSMKHHFGYKNILFVFSGGKGVHCWVMDKEAMNLTSIERRSIVDFLKNAKSIKKIMKKGILESSFHLPFYFEDILKQFNVEIKHYLVLDREVTGNMKHLIKMPFSVHSNGNVSVPIDINRINELKLKDFPTIKQVYEDKSIMNPFLEIFNNFVSEIEI